MRKENLLMIGCLTVIAAFAACILLGSKSEAEACLPEPIPKNMELVTSYPADGGGLPADREAVLVFSTGKLNSNEAGAYAFTFPPHGFVVWDDSGALPAPVAVEVLEKKHQDSKWDGIGLPAEIREWSSSVSGKSATRVYRLKAEAGWTTGTIYRVDFEYGDVSGMRGPPFPEEPVWIPQSIHFTAGAAAGPLTVPTGELQADFEKEYAMCWESCVDDCAMSCQGLAIAVQRFHLSSYALTVDDSTGPMIVRFYSSGSDLQDTGLYASRSYILLPDDTPSSLDLVYLRRGPIMWDDYVAGDGCEVCLAITVEAPDGTVLDASAQQCFQAYQALKPDEPCDADDWKEEGGDEPPTPLHWPTCESETGGETGTADVIQSDAGATPEGQPEIQVGTKPTDALSGGGVATEDGATPGGGGGKGCSSGAAAPPDSSWLPSILLFLPLLLAVAFRARRRRYYCDVGPVLGVRW